MNGRLYDPLLRRFLNADENIQDPTNTQNYNKYGYVMNNPLMYWDPSGEFIWFVIAAAAIIGGYTAGVKANGSWNPFKWNLKETGWQILGGALVGAVAGATGAWVGQAATAFAASAMGIQGGILGGAIAGLAGGAIGGAVSGLGNALVFGEAIGRSIVKGFISGAIGGAIIGGAVGGIQTLAQNAKALDPSQMRNVITGKTVAEGRGVWALNNSPKPTTVGKVAKIELGMPSEEVLLGNGNGNLKLQDLGDGVKSTPQPNEIYQNVEEFTRTGKGYLNGNLNVSQSDYESLLQGYTQNSVPIVGKNGITYPYSTGVFKGSFYISTSGQQPSMHIINKLNGFEFKIRFNILQK